MIGVVPVIPPWMAEIVLPPMLTHLMLSVPLTNPCKLATEDEELPHVEEDVRFRTDPSEYVPVAV